MSESSEPVASPPPTAAYPTAPPPGYAQGAAYPPNASYTPYQSYGYPYPYSTMPPPTLPNGMAITGMVLGIVGAVTALFYIGGVIGIVGLVFSIIALRAVNRREAAGRGMAIAGLVTSIVAIIVSAVEIVFIVWVIHTATNCAHLDPNTNPTQYNQCMDNGVLGG